MNRFIFASYSFRNRFVFVPNLSIFVVNRSKSLRVVSNSFQIVSYSLQVVTVPYINIFQQPYSGPLDMEISRIIEIDGMDSVS